MNEKTKIQWRPIDDVRPYPNNPRHNDDAVEYVANSIREFGWQQPIVVDTDGTIIAGHTRHKAAKMLGMETVPVVVADNLTPAQVNAYRLADNKVAEAATWDMEALAVELEGLEVDFDMGQFGLYVADVAEEVESMFDNDEKESRLATELDERKEYVVIRIDNDVDWAQAQTLFGLEKRKRWKTNKNGTGGGDERTCRVVTWEDFIRRFLGDYDA